MYAKLFSRITESSLMEEPLPVRYVFVMLLAISDPHGYVVGTDVAIARRLNIPLKDFQEAMLTLLSPDPNSGSPELDGKRVVISDAERGYRIVNFVAYRDTKDPEERREYMRKYMAEYRKKGRPVNSCKQELADLTHADAKEDAKEEDKKRWNSAPLSSEIAKILDKWNAGNLPRCLVVSDKRRRTLEVRLREPFFALNWTQAMARIQSSTFCHGENNRGWRASFEWFISPDAVTKIMEGKYDNRQHKPEQNMNKVW